MSKEINLLIISYLSHIFIRIMEILHTNVFQTFS